MSAATAVSVLESSIRSRHERIWAQAACRGPHQEIFFPPAVSETRRAKRRREARAKEICSSCPIIDDCLAVALERNEQHGIWGGMTEKERRLQVAITN